MDTVIAYMPSILQGTLVTVELAIGSVLLSVLLGLLGSWAKLSKSRAAHMVGNAYTTLIRGVPDLVLMLLLFFGGQTLLNQVGDATGWWGYLEVNQFTAGVLHHDDPNLGRVVGVSLLDRPHADLAVGRRRGPDVSTDRLDLDRSARRDLAGPFEAVRSARAAGALRSSRVAGSFGIAHDCPSFPLSM